MPLRSPLCLCLISPAQALACWPQAHIFHSAWHSQVCFLSPQPNPSCTVHIHHHVFTCTLKKKLCALYPWLSFTRHALRKKEGVPASSPRTFSITYSEVTSFLQFSSIISILVSQGVDFMPETWVQVPLILSKYTYVQHCHVAFHWKISV